MTLKYTTAFTFTETLSFVIISCGGTSNAINLKLTFTILSIPGRTIINPGPFVLKNLPSLKITPLSYSFKTFMDDSIKKAMTIRNIGNAPILTSPKRVMEL